RQMKAAEVAADIQQLSLGEQQIAVESQLWQAWAGYTRGLDQWEITRSNIRLAAENLDIALERYRLGRASQLDLRTAQISVLQAANEELMARYTLKLYEIRMKTLAGTLAAELENLP
ncbi:MAG: TolC family protein, partial [bacterium]